ncbi:MAG: hypothetical protein K5924_05895 [Chloroflexi bacterium]|nr:hypothetical protein [Chloroflexota bacterium]
MPDTAIGYVILGIGILVILGVVFAISSRAGGSAGRPTPPRGVHLPAPSFLPVVMSVGMGLLGAGLAFRAEGELANVFLAVPGLLVLVIGIVAWIRAANHEWRDTEHGSHDDAAAH